MNRRLIFIIPLLLAICIVLIPIFLTLPGQTRLWGEIQNFGHTPLIGTLALVLLWLSRLVLSSKIKKPVIHFYVAFFIAIFLGGSIEIAQIFLPGDADWFDFFRDILGAGAFLCFFAAFDPHLISYYHRRSRGILKFPLIISVVLMAVAITPGILWVSAYIQKIKIEPFICDFNSNLELKFIDVKDANLSLVHAPSQWKKSDEDLVGELDLKTVGNPGFTMVEPGSDWGKYKDLSFEIYSPVDTAIMIYFVVEDFSGQDIDEDRFNDALKVNPGLNEISIPIKKIENGPVSRKLDLNDIRDFYLYTAAPKSNLRLFIDNIKLTI
jgi:hypothetical protein